MLRWFPALLVLGGLLALPGIAAATEPVRHIGIYVEPFYESAATPDGRPHVAVGNPFDALLASNRQEDILAARDLIVRDPQMITPMTMMVLAIRLYDIGLRDDAVFWFYVAKNRRIVMTEVLNMRLLSQAVSRPWLVRSSTATPSATLASKQSCRPRRSIGLRKILTR